MKKIWKISLIVFSVLLLLITFGIFYVFATFKPNDLKPRITDYFQQKYQRKLLIPGDLQLTLLPLLHIESGSVSLMEKNGQDVFASLESVKLSLVWRPLIDGRLEVDGVTLEAPSVHMKKFSDGTTNIDDFFAGGGAPPQFDIKSLKINRASWVFDDQATQWKMRNANLQVARLANGVPTDFKFDGDLRLNQDQFNVHIDLNSPLLFDLAKQYFSLEKLNLAIKGTSKAANTTTLNDIALNATGAMTFDAAKKLTHLGDWALQSQLVNGEKKWNAKVAFSEAEQQGKNWWAKNISSQAEQQTAAYHLNTTLNMPELSLIDARMSGKEIKLTTQWAAKPDVKKGGAQKNQNAIDAVLTLGALDDVNDTSEPTNIYNLRAAHLEAKGMVDAAPVKLQAAGDIQIINNNQMVTKGPLKLQFNYQSVGLALEGSLKTEAKIMLEREQYDVSPLSLDLKITPTDFKRPMILIAGGAMNADLKRKIVSGKLQGKLNGVKLEGKIGMAGLTPPAYTFDVLLSEFNTVWLDNKTSAEKKHGDLPDFGWLKKLNANGVLRIGELISADKRASNVRIDVKSDK